MRLIAALAWYRETPAFLDRLVMSLAGVVDELVALDGRWKGFADGEVCFSTGEEHDALANAGIEQGVSVRVVECARPFVSQVAKRARLMELAAADADWVLVIDGDEWVESVDAVSLRASLDLTSLNVAEVTLQRTNEQWPHSGLPNRPYAVRRLYRAQDEAGHLLTVETAHNGVRLGHRWLLGDRAHVTLEPSLNLSPLIRLHHDADRGPERAEARKAYYLGRQDQRVEAWR